jgi:IS5 family transposase
VQKRKEIEEKKKRAQREARARATGPDSSNSKARGGDTNAVGATTTAAAAAAPSSSSAAPTTATTAVKTKPRGGDKARTTRSRDGTWTKKRGRSFFGFKLHTKDDLSGVFIDEYEVTTASVHDNNVDLTKKGEVCVRDRGYAGSGGKGLCVDMIKANRGSPLTSEDRELNRFLSKVRAPVEHPYAVMKRIFHAGRVRVTTIVRVNVRMTFVCTCYNLFRALGLVSMKGP